MKRFRYAVVQWLEKPYKIIDDYACVPGSWIVLTRKMDRRVIVAYPVENPWETEKRVKRRQRRSDEWKFYLSIVKYDTDSYEDAQNVVKNMIDDDHRKYKSQHKKNRDKELSQKKIRRSKRNNKNSENDDKSLKNKKKRVTRKKQKAVKHRSNVIEPAESKSVSEVVSSSGPSACSNENKLSIFSPNDAKTIQKIPVETSDIVNHAEKTADHESSQERLCYVKNTEVAAVKYRSKVIEPAESNSVSEVVSSSNQALACTNEKQLPPAFANSCTEKIPVKYNHENHIEKTGDFENFTQIRVSVIKHTSDYIDNNSVRSFGSVKKYILSRWY